MFIIFTVLYILVAAAMIVLILMQRGEGANAGAGFGGGSSATVFGARGAASFMTRATSVLGALFFVISLGMGIYVSRSGAPTTSSQDLGVMAGSPSRSASPKNAATTATHVPGASAPAAHAQSAAGKPAAAQPAGAVPAPTAPANGASSGNGNGS